jgi:hypothetical protein
MEQQVRDLVESFLTAVDPVLGNRYTAVLYGSAARGDWHPDRSDINLLLVADTLSCAELRGLGPALAALPEAWRSPPLLFTGDEWARSLDVFPIELTDMLLAHEVLRGTDPLPGVQAHPSQLRASLERELHAKLVRLRQGYALRASDPQALGAFATGTLGTILVLARATLVLLGRPVPERPAAVLQAFAEVTGAATAPLVELATHRDEVEWSCPAALFEAYLECVAAASAYLDHHQPGVA